ncbi:uncharacterized protein F5Z01DRAFT_659185 [Emericellopsis atlantica]|uniref:T6SS Phospholipase effector Tle1-like catalytic domain-containing protein n=1 Tax=Emericellopsis atlantica TaxID=2614577 RepID=A0A9P7ZJ80_9HYPO|nr:uncharacterized protein F5Z01DRAFT_659185 [Emericellopsis atlantica]KAG9253118.1 hypothetical protein F5Z01DRAFT_659185 [Emericellopsis atlantica]
MPAFVETGARQAGPKKLVLCFDGTGNSFSGSNADTNVVKILNKLERNEPGQFHYYQTGIGTYDVDEKSVHKTKIGEIQSSISQTIDQAIGTTFDHHVMAGYRFLMRYYVSGAKIYMFGFSRGAFTARFLARMIHTVGLLCKGNEEMVPFAYRLYQRYLAGETEDFVKASSGTQRNKDIDVDEQTRQSDTLEHHHGQGFELALDKIAAFSRTFCRKEFTDNDGVMEASNIKVYFLGIWDCVNSVAVLERSAPIPQPVKGTAHHVRHAVAVDERRVKFKAALMTQDTSCVTQNDEDIKEVWFPGCHGDVGGGWPAAENNPLDTSNRQGMSWWQRVKSIFTTRKAKAATRDVRLDLFQMSDIPLAWMIRELELLGEEEPSAALKWCTSVHGFKRAFQEKKRQALSGLIHDSLSFGTGTGMFTVLLWKLMEFLPIIKRWELEREKWVNVRFPLNKGSTRDIPRDALLHTSLLSRLQNDEKYCPPNNHGGQLLPCLKHKGTVTNFISIMEDGKIADPDHQLYTFARTD